jgi:UDP-N-acetyl-2-amino-2-deoxyglucuronate dehydrogenase
MNHSEKMKVAIIGCGYQGGRLASAIQLTGWLTVTACMDIDRAAADKLASSLADVSVFSTVEDLLEKSGVDLVMIATPHDVLAKISLQAIRAGKHVLSEKPLGLNDQEVAIVEQVLEKTPLYFLPGYSFRFLPGWYKVKELISEGVVGELLSIEGCFAIGPMDGDWSAMPERGGGPLMFIGSHLIDQASWYLQDEPVSVYGKVRYRSDTKTDETSIFQVNYARGAAAQLLVSQAVSSKVYQMDIYGRQGQIHLSSLGYLDYEIKVVSSTVEAFNQPVILHPQTSLDPRDHMHLHQLNEFVQAIMTGSPLPVTIQDGRRVLKVIAAVHESSRTGEVISIG